ncbi:MAG: HAD family phosphatase [Anaerolineae bacterium]|nr:HAD family phosphatase [Anaerolineae bacterium]
MSYRLLACDIDDTLVRFPNPPTQRVVGAIRAAAAAGVTVCLVTGRAYRRARPIAEALGLDTPLICNHGGSIRSARTGETIHRQTLPCSLAAEIVAWLQRQAVRQLVFDGDVVYHNALPGEVIADFAVYTTGDHSVYAPDVLSILPEQVEIILNTSLDHERLAAVYAGAQARYGDRVRVLFSHPFGVDVMPQSSKSAALAWLCAHCGIARHEVIAVGDGDNDVDMLAWAGLGVAMGDGTDRARAAADVVAPPFAADGLAWAVERHILDHTTPIR